MQNLKPLVLLLALALLLSGCSPAMAKPDAAPVTGEDFTPYAVTDDLGHTFAIDRPLRAIVPSGKLAQVILLGLAPDLMVGLGDKLNEGMAPYLPDYARLAELPYFGSILGTNALDIEALAATDAQLIIDMGYTKQGYQEELERTERLTGIPCAFFAADLATYGSAIRKLGRLLGREERAEAMAQWCEQVYARALSVMDAVGENRIDALVLSEVDLHVIAKSQPQAEVINLVCNNLAVIENASGKGTGNAVSMEQLALWNPDFIIFNSDSAYEQAAIDPAWRTLTAIQSGNYVASPHQPHNWTIAPPATQRYLALLWLPAILYPDYCDYDLKAEVTSYYELFYGVKLTDAQYAELMKYAFLHAGLS